MFKSCSIRLVLELMTEGCSMLPDQQSMQLNVLTFQIVLSIRQMLVGIQFMGEFLILSRGSLCEN